MSRRSIIVLKFGGSVLTDGETVERAVHEVHAFRRAGYRVVAVVSALAGRTDQLLAACARDGITQPSLIAARLAVGEAESAECLAARLERAGVHARVLTPRELRLHACGDPLDAEPLGVDVAPIHRAFETDETVVVPGFVACGADGATVTLGRGGSDLSALVLAEALHSRCRLVKDVDGLYEWDPARPGHGRPRRFARATWDVALQTDGGIVQHKATRFARDREIEFELGGLCSHDPTVIGAGTSRFAPAQHEDRPASVAILGVGTVGSAVLECLRRLPERFRIVALGVRADHWVHRDLRLSPIAGSVSQAASCGADLIVEALGGVIDAARAIELALNSGSHVVTANKEVIARHGRELEGLAQRRGRQLLFSAAVGGCAPVIEVIRSLGAGAVRRIRGVLNATANVVLDRCASGADLRSGVEEARNRGLAERDVSSDLDGRDAANKLAVLAGVLGQPLREDQTIHRRSIASVLDRLAGPAAPRFRQVARLERQEGGIVGEVLTTGVAESDPLFAVGDDGNAADIEWDDGSSDLIRGRGAGGRPTAESILGDLLELRRHDIARESVGVHSSRQDPAHVTAT